MSNPFLPLWEYIPDGEPRVFGDRVYIYGSHDKAGSDRFCDYVLKVWSAPVSDLNHWVCHGVSFSTLTDTPWTHNELYAPDVVERDGKYYLYAYIVGAKGCVAVADCPEGPFTLLSQYQYAEEDAGDEGIFNDSGVLVDGTKAYIYYGYQKQFFGELEEDMYSIKKGSLRENLIPQGEDENDFFEASSIRKIGDKYYMIYSPRIGSRLNYAIAEKPEGPYQIMGTIIDNGVDFPGGNDHGSVACIQGQWYIFYHRMTNNTIMSRRACVEKIEILENGTIPQVEMTSLGFADSLNPYEITPADIACVLKGGCYITEHNPFQRVITHITDGCVMGYKYFDFGSFGNPADRILSLKVRGQGAEAIVKIYADSDTEGECIGIIKIGTSDGIYQGNIKALEGRHALYFVVESPYKDWSSFYFEGRNLFDLESFYIQ